MKSLQRLCAAFVLTLSLTAPAFAGEISTGIGIAPLPPPPQQQQSSVIGGGMKTPLDADEAASLSPGAEIGLSLLQSVLALL